MIRLAILSISLTLVLFSAQVKSIGMSWSSTTLGIVELFSEFSATPTQALNKWWAFNMATSNVKTDVIPNVRPNIKPNRKPNVSHSSDYTRGEPILIKFAELDDFESWQINNDTVMGGVSSSQLAPLHLMRQEHVVIFSGHVSLQNNGGFASVEFKLGQDHVSQLSRKNALHTRFRILGDGKRYQLRLKTPQLKYGEAYVAEFDTIGSHTEQEWSEHRFTASDFRVSFRGRTIEQAPPLDLDQIIKVGVLIANQQQGEFRIGLDTIHFE